MVWPFLKKEDRKKDLLPELPELPELPPLLIEKKPKTELPPLPSFPSSAVGEKISNEIVKHAVRESEIDIKPRTIELEETKKAPIHLSQELAKKPIKQAKEEPLFVRIDKYRESLINFQEIKKKLLEIESILKDIKDIRAREESQLQEWEAEIQEAKAKLDKIDKTLFSKLEE